MKAYVFFVPDEPGSPYVVDSINAVYLDRQKALEFWTFDYCCYPEVNPDPEQILEAKELFEQAEKDGEIMEHEGACMQVLEVNER